jgi:hypothetical protein
MAANEYVEGGSRSDHRRSRRRWAFILSFVFFCVGRSSVLGYTPLLVISLVFFVLGVIQSHIIDRNK